MKNGNRMMMELERQFLEACEIHSPKKLQSTLESGLDPVAPLQGKRPIDWLVEMYLRSDRFEKCLRILLAAGATIDFPELEATLLGDSAVLAEMLKSDPGISHRRYDLPAAFTSCQGVTLLHVCAEFGGVPCAKVLLDAGADINAPAHVDDQGFGGQSPIFHCVNSIFNHGRPMMELLVDSGVNLETRLKGLYWGRGQDWETLLVDVTPMSYAQCGLLPQFHRDEAEVHANVSYLYSRRFGSSMPSVNVPNKYLTKP